MRFEPMAPLGVGARDHGGRRNPASRSAAASGSRDQSVSGLALLGRSLAVCAVLAAGFSGTIMALGWQVDGLLPAQAATPAFDAVAMPRPRVRLTSDLNAEPRQEQALSASPFLALSRIDRVPHELLAPDGPTAEGFDPNDVLAFGPMRVRRHLVETVIKASRTADADPVLLMAIADKESSFLSDVQARTSSATGLFQFIERTWLQVVREFGAKHGFTKEAEAITRLDDELVVADSAERARILELRRDPHLATVLAAEMLSRDRARIARRIGRDLTQGETYLAHFLGPDDAERFLEKVVGEPNSVASKLLPKPARANRPIFFARKGRKAKGLSVAEVHRKFEAMMDMRLERYRNVQQAAARPLVEASMR